MLWRPRAPACCCSLWSPRCAGPAVVCGTSRGICCISTATSGSASAIPHMLWTGADFTTANPRRDRVLVDDVGSHGRRGDRVPARDAVDPVAPSRHPGERRRTRRRPRGVVRLTGRRLGAFERPGRAVLRLALPSTEPAGRAGTPLTRRGPRRPRARDLRPPGGRRHAPARRPASRHARADRGALRHAHDRRAARARAADDRRRGGRSPRSSPCSRRPAGPPARRRCSCATTPRATRSASTRSSASSGSGACGTRRCPPARGHRLAVAPAVARCVGGCRSRAYVAPRPATPTSISAAPVPGWTPCAPTSAVPASPSAQIHLEAFTV